MHPLTPSHPQVSVSECVVGDIVLIDTGDKLPADGVFLNGHDMEVDESAMTGESDLMPKSPAFGMHFTAH